MLTLLSGSLCPQILANVIIFICGNLAGAYHKHLMELALQQTYQDTCNCIKSRIKLEFEKRQQVKYMFGLPRYLRCYWNDAVTANGEGAHRHQQETRVASRLVTLPAQLWAVCPVD